MRETPSGGVGSIQDQGVNYIQLNIQPPIPLLNTELRNATLNKDYERSTPLDRAQLAAQPGQPWPRGPRMGGVREHRRGGWGEDEFGKRARPWIGASPYVLLPFLLKSETQGRSWGPPLCPLLVQPQSLHLPTRIQRSEGWSFRPQFPQRRRRRRWLQRETGLVPHLRPSGSSRWCCAEEARRRSQIPGPGHGPPPCCSDQLGWAALWAAGIGVDAGCIRSAWLSLPLT